MLKILLMLWLRLIPVKNLSFLVQGVEVEVLVDKMFAGDKTDEML